VDGRANREKLRWPLRLTSERCGGVLVLVAAGRLSHASADHLKTALDEAIRTETGGLVLDLGGVDYVSSGGLVAIEDAAERLSQAGGRLALCNVAGPIRVAFDLGGLLSKLVIEPGREGAAGRVRRS